MRTLKDRKLFQRLFLSYVLLTGCTAIIVSVILFSFFYRASLREVEYVSAQMLEQTGASSQFLNDQILSLVTQMQVEPNILNYLHMKQNDKLAEYKASLELQRYQALFPYINHIGLYNKSLDRYLNTKGYEDNNLIVSTYLQVPRDRDQILFTPTTLQNPYDQNNSTRALTCISFLVRQNDIYASIVINVNESFIHDNISAISIDEMSTDDVFVVNHEGIVLSHINSSEFMKDYSDAPYMNRILVNDESGGAFRGTINGDLYLITYYRNVYPDWIYVNMRDYRMLNESLTSLLLTVILIAILFWILGTAVAFLTAKKIYFPIHGLLGKLPPNQSKDPDEIAFLGHVIDSTIQDNKQLMHTAFSGTKAMKEQHLRKILAGEVLSLIVEDSLNISFPQAASFQVIVAQIDSYNKMLSLSPPEDRVLLKFAIRNVMEELLNKYGKCESVEFRENLIAALVSSVEQAEMNRLKNDLEQIVSIFNSSFQLSLSFGIGFNQKQPAGIRESFLSAVDAVQYKMFQGKGSIIPAESVAGRSDKISLYPLQNEKSIIEAINLQDTPLIQIRVKQFIGQLRNGSYHDLQFFISRLMTELSSVYASSASYNRDILINKNHKAILTVSNIESIDELSKLLTEYCVQICGIISDSQESKSVQIVLAIKDFIEQNYSNPNINLAEAADRIGLSKDYTGRLFKTTTNLSFNDYLNQVRLENAYRLLTDSKLSVAEICEETGIANHSYFYTLFRKKYGLTPSAYRRTHHLSQTCNPEE